MAAALHSMHDDKVQPSLSGMPPALPAFWVCDGVVTSALCAARGWKLLCGISGGPDTVHVGVVASPHSWSPFGAQRGAAACEWAQLR